MYSWQNPFHILAQVIKETGAVCIGILPDFYILAYAQIEFQQISINCAGCFQSLAEEALFELDEPIEIVLIFF